MRIGSAHALAFRGSARERTGPKTVEIRSEYHPGGGALVSADIFMEREAARYIFVWGFFAFCALREFESQMDDGVFMCLLHTTRAAI